MAYNPLTGKYTPDAAPSKKSVSKTTKTPTEAEVNAQLAAVTSGLDKSITSIQDYAKTLGYDISSGTPVKIETAGGGGGGSGLTDAQIAAQAAAAQAARESAAAAAEKERQGKSAYALLLAEFRVQE